MSFKACVYNCKVLCQNNDLEHVISHLFLTTDRDMLSHAERVGHQDKDLFSVWEDVLLLYVGSSKADQERTKHSYNPFHLYSVPEDPAGFDDSPTDF